MKAEKFEILKNWLAASEGEDPDRFILRFFEAQGVRGWRRDRVRIHAGTVLLIPSKDSI